MKKLHNDVSYRSTDVHHRWCGAYLHRRIREIEDLIRNNSVR